MSIRYLAHELYHRTREVEALEQALANLPLDAPLPERTRLELDLHQARHELARVRQVMAAKKETPHI
jgi:hypothetical protein